jgi:hypothetical protein
VLAERGLDLIEVKKGRNNCIAVGEGDGEGWNITDTEKIESFNS